MNHKKRSESEVVMGLMCSAKDQRQERIEDHHSGQNDGVYTADSWRSADQYYYTKPNSAHVMAPIPESISHHTSAKVIINNLKKSNYYIMYAYWTS